jgi:sugar O-acyltransferase (sialic acid O-acetyltransferase NeuD family)
LKEIYIIGAGGFGREVFDIIGSINLVQPTYRVAGFIDDDRTLTGTEISGVPVVCGTDEALSLKDEDGGKPLAAMTVAAPKIREALVKKLGDVFGWEDIVHPSSYISPSAKIGEGCIFQTQSFISADARIGAHCIVNRASGFGHDVTAGDFVSLMSFCDICGHVSLGDRVYAGSSVAVVPDVNVGADAYLCAGSTVFNDVDAGATVIGNPARRVK